jgi:hypothetical protein
LPGLQALVRRIARRMAQNNTCLNPYLAVPSAPTFYWRARGLQGYIEKNIFQWFRQQLDEVRGVATK